MKSWRYNQKAHASFTIITTLLHKCFLLSSKIKLQYSREQQEKAVWVQIQKWDWMNEDEKVIIQDKLYLHPIFLLEKSVNLKKVQNVEFSSILVFSEILTG